VIEYLHIRDVGVIAEADVELAPGLVVVTGETGAGKTMVMTALDLLFGGKSNPALIRAGSVKAEVEAGIRVEDPAALAQRHDLDVDDDLLILGRSVAPQRSRAWLAGRGAPASVLADIGDDLVVRHGQNDQRRLGSGRYRRALLDRFAGGAHGARLTSFARLYEAYQAAASEVAAIEAKVAAAGQRADLLRHGVTEISAVNPVDGEDHAVRTELHRLENAIDLRTAFSQAYEALRGEEGSAESGLGAAAAGLRRAARFDPQAEALADTIAQAQAVVSDVASQLITQQQSLDTDQARLDELQGRLAALNSLKRKYGPQLADVLDWCAKAEADLATVDGAEGLLAAAHARQAELASQLVDEGSELTRSRVAAATELSEDITAELGGLAMPHARMLITVQPAAEDAGHPLELPDGRRVALRRDGFDEVAFAFVAHAGAPPRPVDQGASGGELSRVMLALEVALAGAHPVPVFVFDEVDAGIGGRAAVEVGRRLAALARTAQVLVVTHLPQVAAFADQHVLVSKQPDGQVTASSVITLDGEQRRRELARMMAGQDGSDSALAHAEELINLAERERAGAPGR